jgi:hypothetical protein
MYQRPGQPNWSHSQRSTRTFTQSNVFNFEVCALRRRNIPADDDGGAELSYSGRLGCCAARMVISAQLGIPKRTPVRLELADTVAGSELRIKLIEGLARPGVELLFENDVRSTIASARIPVGIPLGRASLEQ